MRSLAPKAFTVNEITDNHLNAPSLTETQVKQGEYLALNESTQPGYSYYYNPRISGRGGGVATIYNTNIGITQTTGHEANSFEVLSLRVASPCPASKLNNFILYTIVPRALTLSFL